MGLYIFVCMYVHMYVFTYTVSTCISAIYESVKKINNI